MAIDKGKFQEEEEAAAVARFHKIILGWDYKQLLKETEKPEVVNANRKYRIRVLVCAPSNSALDEIVLRLRDENAQTYAPKIVRIGVKPHHSVKSVWLDHLVAQRRGSAIDKPKQGTTGTDDDSIKTSILDEAAIVFSTLSFSGAPVLAKSNRGFDVVIIDEAAQAIQSPSLLVVSFALLGSSFFQGGLGGFSDMDNDAHARCDSILHSHRSISLWNCALFAAKNWKAAWPLISKSLSFWLFGAEPKDAPLMD
ncbi:hypothetical protein F2Q70_00035437 [Brassica cretica]|uniref:DNA2/NAM7 helicase helicase domain-containing protein n=1 Tax=Brassica cretica TaxID=69181 RepID=A0A8S9JXJ5_BRACR|nr:hypothetical protein F2Q70_00035437 [Brassica cretica]